MNGIRPASCWRIKRLGDLGRIVTGKTPLTRVAGNFGGEIPFITPSDMDERRIIADTKRYLTQMGAASVSGFRIPQGAVMVSCIGSDMGKVAIAGCDAVTNQQINSIIVDADISNLFIYYNLSMRKAELQHLASGGSAQPILNKGQFSQLPISLPELKEQRAIAHILGTLDDKIELNRRMNETLEAIARAIFKSWFIDFDPVRAKAEGRDPGLPNHIADLFPESFENSAIGEVPSSWQIKGLDEIATFLNGLALQKYPPTNDETLPVIKIAQLRAGNSIGADQASLDVPHEYVIQDGDLLFSWSGSLEVKIWCGGKGALNQHLFKVTSENYPKWFYYLWILHHLPNFRSIAAGKATTMGHIQRKHLSEAKVVVPPDALIRKCDALLSGMFDRAISSTLEARCLSEIRDALLPKLISGELRVKDVEKFLEKETS